MNKKWGNLIVGLGIGSAFIGVGIPFLAWGGVYAIAIGIFIYNIGIGGWVYELYKVDRAKEHKKLAELIHREAEKRGIREIEIRKRDKIFEVVLYGNVVMYYPDHLYAGTVGELIRRNSNGIKIII